MGLSPIYPDEQTEIRSVYLIQNNNGPNTGHSLNFVTCEQIFNMLIFALELTLPWGLLGYLQGKPLCITLKEQILAKPTFSSFATIYQT